MSCEKDKFIIKYNLQILMRHKFTEANTFMKQKKKNVNYLVDSICQEIAFEMYNQRTTTDFHP